MARINKAKDGPPGPRGEIGEKGERGEKGENAKSVEFFQEIPASTWHIVHKLNKRPTILVQDSANSEVEGDIEFINAEELNLHFTAAFSGVAYIT